MILKRQLAEQEALGQRAEQLIRQEIRDIQSFIEEHVDWDHLVDDWSEKEASLGSSFTFTPRDINHLLTTVDEDEFLVLRAKMIQIQKVKDGLLEQGYVVDSPVEVDKSEAEFNLSSGERIVAEWTKDTKEALKLMGERRYDNILKSVDPFYDKSDQIIDLLRDIEVKDELQVQPAIAAALKRKLQRICDEFDKADADFVAREAQDRPIAPLLSGLQELAKTINADPREWAYKYLGRLPHWATDGLGYIRFLPELQDMTEEKRKEAGLLEIHQALQAAGLDDLTGLTKSGENAVEISTRAKAFAEFMAVPGSKEEHVQTYLANIIANTFIHELSHYVHKQKLPLSWLRRFVKVTRREQVAVSHYAEKTKEHGTDMGNSPLGEDLADSIAGYINEPLKLINNVPERFELIQEILQVYPDQQIHAILHNPVGHPDRSLATLILVPPDEIRKRLDELKELEREYAQSG